MKKKIIAVAAAALLAIGALALAGCSVSSKNANTSNTSNTSNATTNTTASSGTKLIVGFDQDYPPYGFLDDKGGYTGFDLDLAAEVASRNGWEVSYSPIDWAAKDALLNSGSITCIWNGFTYEGRENDYTWSEPYMLNEQVVVAKKGSAVTDEASLAGKTVMTQADSGALEVLEDPDGKKALADTFGSLQTISDYNNAFMQLDSGLVDAVACDLSIAQYQMSANPDKYQIIDTLSSEHYAVGFKKGNTEMANKVTNTLRDMYNDGTVKKLCEKYSEYGLSFDNWCLK